MLSLVKEILVTLLTLRKEISEGIITLQECLSVLKSMPNNKTPGTDGIPTEWYKFFFSDIGQTVVDSFNYAFNHGNLSPDQRRGIINLIPKKDKNPTSLKNWRPISLNTDYKLVSKCIAVRIKRSCTILSMVTKLVS